MKKAWILLILLFTLSLTGCSKQKDIYKEQILAIESNYEKKIISESGLYYKGEEIYFRTILKDQLKKDKMEFNNEVSSYFVSGYYEGKVFYSYVFDFKKIMIGYINTSDYSIHNIYVSSENSSQLYIGNINDNYCIFYKTNYMIHGKFVEYYVYDYLSNTIIESDSNQNGIDTSVVDKYEKEVVLSISRVSYLYNNESYEISARDGEAIIKKEDFNIEINYDYILNKSDILKEIDKIVGDRKDQLGMDIFSIDGALYIVVYSESTKFGSGDLIPVIFSYDIATDTFDYIGATPYKEILYIE